MGLSEYITDNTRITLAYKKNPSIAYLPGRGNIYYKDFNINEFIVEKIGSVKNLNVNNYFLLLLDDIYGVTSFKSVRDSDCSDIKVASYDFCINDEIYYMACPPNVDFFDVLSWCPSEKNRLELADEILKLFALDTYTWQRDRCSYNIMFEIHSNGEFHLSKIYDFEESLSIDALYDNVMYDNALYKFFNVDDYYKLFDIYPQFRKYLEDYQKIDLCKEITSMFLERDFDIKNFSLDKYKKFEEASQKMLCKILE